MKLDIKTCTIKRKNIESAPELEFVTISLFKEWKNKQMIPQNQFGAIWNGGQKLSSLDGSGDRLKCGIVE